MVGGKVVGGEVVERGTVVVGGALVVGGTVVVRGTVVVISGQVGHVTTGQPEGSDVVGGGINGIPFGSVGVTAQDKSGKTSESSVH